MKLKPDEIKTMSNALTLKMFKLSEQLKSGKITKEQYQTKDKKLRSQAYKHRRLIIGI